MGLRIGFLPKNGEEHWEDAVLKYSVFWNLYGCLILCKLVQILQNDYGPTNFVIYESQCIFSVSSFLLSPNKIMGFFGQEWLFSCLFSA